MYDEYRDSVRDSAGGSHLKPTSRILFYGQRNNFANILLGSFVFWIIFGSCTLSSLSISALAASNVPSKLSDLYLPPPEIGNRKLELSIYERSPSQGNDNDHVLENQIVFRLFDSNTNETIEHVTYGINITNHETGKRLFPGGSLFHSHKGPLTLQFLYNDTASPRIVVNRDYFTNGWQDDENGLANVVTNESFGAGFYDFDVAIYQLTSPKNNTTTSSSNSSSSLQSSDLDDRRIFSPDQAPVFP